MKHPGGASNTDLVAELHFHWPLTKPSEAPAHVLTERPSDVAVVAPHGLTEEVCERVSAAEEFPEDVFWVAECEVVVEGLSIVVMAP